MKNNSLILIAIVIIVGVFLTFISEKQTADLLIINATVYTVDKNNSIAEAVAIRGNRIVGVGSTKDIQNHFTSQNIIDAKDKTIVPGLIDAHAHVLGLGIALSELNFVGTTSAQQIADMVAAKIKDTKPGEWIRGRGWDQNDWGNGGEETPFPTAAMLDKISPNNPVILNRIDGHAIWVNSKAMEVAGIKNDSKRIVDGGTIVRNSNNEPTGIFVDNAEKIIRTAVPDYSLEEKSAMYAKAFQECVRYGLTSVHDMGIDKDDFEIYRKYSIQKKLPIRIYAMVGGTGPLWNEMMHDGPYTDAVTEMFSVHGLKLYADGALGSRGAALLAPYSDDPENSGLLTSNPDSMEAAIEQALQNGFQVSVHAIGDRANRVVLDQFEKAEKKFPLEAANARLRIEHAQVVDREDIPRFKKLHVIPSMQPTHATSDMYWAQARLGSERILGAYAWRSFLDDGNVIPGGSDFPVENPNPLLGFYAASTRQDREGIPATVEDVEKKFQLASDGIKDPDDFDGGWYVKQKMTRQEALRSFTLWGAYAEFAENKKGSIETGKLADIVILTKDIMTVEPKEILSTEVATTIVDGKIRYQKPVLVH
jgi:predicted amidohydrolase YtcJ